MSAPTVALRAIRRAVRAGRWSPDPHLVKQLAKRGLPLSDVVAALSSAEQIEPHDMRPLNEGGESWRVYGVDSDSRLLGIGVELVKGADGGFVVVVTAFVKEKHR
jgi:hypothetical protein